MIKDGMYYEWFQTAGGDFRLRIWEDGVCIWDEVIPAKDYYG